MNDTTDTTPCDSQEYMLATLCPKAARRRTLLSYLALGCADHLMDMEHLDRVCFQERTDAPWAPENTLALLAELEGSGDIEVLWRRFQDGSYVPALVVLLRLPAWVAWETCDDPYDMP